MKRLVCSLMFCLFCVFPAIADDGQGHNHHEDLNQTQLGTVHFPVSCAASVQKPFERGVALLHSFWYEEAEKEFEQIAKDDPHCAMAHWGVAMSLWHQLWNEPDAKVIKHGLKETFQRLLHILNGFIDDIIKPDIDPFFFSCLGRLQFRADIETYNNRIRGRSKHHIRFIDSADR